ncbi:MAG: rhomboid family intramembrane serine protease [Verrucomicrobia bacterium]|nr:rhomboid family intramembrane serine protease [Verrucomicrobiota bacterium]
MQWLGPHFPEMARRCGHLAQARWPWVFALLIMGIHGLVAWAGGVHQVPQWYLLLGLRRADVLSGSAWQVLTYAWLHGTWLHAGINALCLLILGGRVEYMLGSRGFLRTLGAGIIGGALGHLLLASGGANASHLVGISGACVALLLVITTLSPESRMFPLPVSGRSLGLGLLTAELLLALADPQLGVPGFSRLGQALVAQGLGTWFALGHACHVGGGVAGYLSARWILRPGPTLMQLRRERERYQAKRRWP